MYKQYEIMAETIDAVSEVLRACEFANVPCTASHQINTFEDSTVMRIYLDVNGMDYIIKYVKEKTYSHFHLNKKRSTKEDILFELSKLVQMVEEYEEAVA